MPDVELSEIVAKCPDNIRDGLRDALAEAISAGCTLQITPLGKGRYRIWVRQRNEEYPDGVVVMDTAQANRTSVKWVQEASETARAAKKTRKR